MLNFNLYLICLCLSAVACCVKQCVLKDNYRLKVYIKYCSADWRQATANKCLVLNTYGYANYSFEWWFGDTQIQYCGWQKGYNDPSCPFFSFKSVPINVIGFPMCIITMKTEDGIIGNCSISIYDDDLVETPPGNINTSEPTTPIETPPGNINTSEPTTPIEQAGSSLAPGQGHLHGISVAVGAGAMAGAVVCIVLLSIVVFFCRRRLCNSSIPTADQENYYSEVKCNRVVYANLDHPEEDENAELPAEYVKIIGVVKDI